MKLGKLCYEAQITGVIAVVIDHREVKYGTICKGILEDSLLPYFDYELDQMAMGGDCIYCFVEEDAQ